MTIEIADIDPDAECKTYDNSAEGRFIALELEATMPENADPEFTSPFRRSPWRASTTEGEISAVDPEVACEGGETILNLLDEFPGYSATGTAFIAVQDNVDLIHFEVSDKTDVRIEVKSEGETSQKVAPSSEMPAEPAPAQPAPAETTVEEAPEPAPQPEPQPQAPEPVVGFTEAPGQTDPYVMDKQVASCGDPSLHQTGTTFFTDGTSGWTQQCANQMGW
ncbi:hypothetical protein [Corynebacterium lubricantis]|uniref:hypothetical protein n=1 Tax=Corynebacterium lubricantis TaxID=541095 RepID=UPI001FE100F8|nr:hypothetical protein [Corynebacterium lubricantis]